MDTSTQNESSSSTSSSSSSNVYYPRYQYTGTGIVVKAKDAVIHSAEIKGLKTGIEVDSTGVVLFENKLCDNKQGIVATKSGNYGVKNRCANCDNWQEQGNPGCSQSCSN